MDVLITIISYLVLMNLAAFALMGIDKLKAKKRAWRIPEATLFLFALFGGSLGSTAGMFFFHHKTRHWYFLYGMPLILMIQIILIILLRHSSIQFSIL
jgi:uncharacterized membrane protein YsdA (DUF1294 family)